MKEQIPVEFEKKLCALLIDVIKFPEYKNLNIKIVLYLKT